MQAKALAPVVADAAHAFQAVTVGESQLAAILDKEHGVVPTGLGGLAGGLPVGLAQGGVGDGFAIHEPVSGFGGRAALQLLREAAGRGRREGRPDGHGAPLSALIA